MHLLQILTNSICVLVKHLSLKILLTIYFFTHSITRCRESGLYTHWLMMTLFPHRDSIKNFVEEFSDEKIVVEYNSLNISNLNDSVIIYSIGMSLSIFIICLEFIYYKFAQIVCKLMYCLTFVL